MKRIKLNKLEVGDLVRYKSRDGIVIYSYPIFNKSGVRLTVTWQGYPSFEFVKHLKCRRIKNPSQELIIWGKSIIWEEFQWENINKLEYLSAMNILNKYKENK